MIANDQVFKLLGLANRARKLTLGMTATLQSIRRGKLKLLIVATDCSENARSKIQFAAQQSQIIILNFGTKDELGRYLGRNEVGIIGVEDSGFANALQKILN